MHAVTNVEAVMSTLFKVISGALLALPLASMLMAGDGVHMASSPFTPSEALTNSKAVSGEEIKVEGTLENAGTNYFTDRRLVLKDLHGSGEINVKAWLPISAPSNQGKRREVISDYLGRPVVLTGMVKTQPVKGVGVTRVLVVKDAIATDK